MKKGVSEGLIFVLSCNLQKWKQNKITFITFLLLSPKFIFLYFLLTFINASIPPQTIPLPNVFKLLNYPSIMLKFKNIYYQILRAILLFWKLLIPFQLERAIYYDKRNILIWIEREIEGMISVSHNKPIWFIDISPYCVCIIHLCNCFCMLI